MSGLVILCSQIDLNTCDLVRYIRFPLDGDDGFNYRSRMSYNAFANSGKARHTSKTHIYACNPATPFFLSRMIEGISIVDVESIWEFYKLIGYDYRRKKYI